MAKRRQPTRGRRPDRPTPPVPSATSGRWQATTDHITGIDLFRALAVIFMIVAHTARLRSGLASPHGDWLAVPMADWPFLAALRFEPLCSAMFLFVAGVSVVLSHANDRTTPSQWLARTLKRLGVLYGIAVLLSLGDPGFQWPDTVVSPGILSIIAVAVAGSALALVSPAPARVLLGLTLTGTVLTAWLEQTGRGIPGINAGAGGMFPLVTLAWVGSLCALVRQRFQTAGLNVLLGSSLVLAVGALAIDHPWITHPATERTVYPGNEVRMALAAITDMLGLYEGDKAVRAVGYWNHSAIFLARTLPLLLGGLMLAIHLWPHVRGRCSRALAWMGREALNLYILHLLILALCQVAGWRPTSGVWGLALVAGIVAVAPVCLRYLSFVPWRLGRVVKTPATLR
jgi:hypothetical protein